MSFYIINNNRFDDTDYAFGEQVKDFNTGEATKCKECGSFLTMLKWLPPYEIKISKNEVGDFILGTFSGFIVSSDFKNKYLSSGLVGLSDFQQVKLNYKGKSVEKEYYYPQIKLIEEKIDIEKSGLHFDGKETCTTCQKAGRVITRMKGLVFQNPDKMKEDAFITKMIGSIVVSKNFIDFVSANKFSNLKFTDASHYKPDWILE